ncbi:CubicO group peptidase, beta-lactamase class C family [Chitinophaga sp. CF118]|uniref:serine hydrolase domain-containing protein n=1 Tax=Chitinophaga sp. CF118 TaxID=1884367 RepID=UPI0008DED397|nr:serine hydrolase domain-containing protein [Chitinophaga sp. CF118]SFD88755.1 CubicO group peptidase, beta-lactamase class C family [Chitinophaga sp. CF118]
MRRFLLCLLFLYCGNVAGQQYNFTPVDNYLEQNAEIYKDNVVVLVSQHGKLIYKKEINLRATDRRVIASASKWLSGAVIMALVDDGKLALTDTVGKFLPIFTLYHKGNITIRQLFSHTSGFPGNSPERYEYSRILTMAEAVDSIAVHTAMIHPPGTTFNYGSVSMQIAGRIAEVVTGKSWQTLFNEKIAIPCDLSASYNMLMNFRNPLLAGGVRTSAEDYLHFLEMIVNKGRYHNKQVLSKNAVEEMLKDQTNGAVIDDTPYLVNPYSPTPDKPVRYGIGNWIDVVTPSGQVLETSSPGAFGTHPWQDEKNGIAGIIFTLSDIKTTAKYSLRIREMIRGIVAHNVTAE